MRFWGGKRSEGHDPGIVRITRQSGDGRACGLSSLSHEVPRFAEASSHRPAIRRQSRRRQAAFKTFKSRVPWEILNNLNTLYSERTCGTGNRMRLWHGRGERTVLVMMTAARATLATLALPACASGRAACQCGGAGQPTLGAAGRDIITTQTAERDPAMFSALVEYRAMTLEARRLAATSR